MAYIYDEPSRTFGEYLLVPGYSGKDCIPANVSLRTPLVKYRRGVEEPPISINIPMVSAVMQAVSNDTMAIALAREGGISFIYGSQTPDAQAQMVRNVKSYKAGFVVSDSNLRPDATLQDVLDLYEKTGHSTVAVTDDDFIALFHQVHNGLCGVLHQQQLLLGGVAQGVSAQGYNNPFCHTYFRVAYITALMVCIRFSASWN